jgi:hypothetical protein
VKLQGAETNITKYFDINIPQIFLTVDVCAGIRSFFSNPQVSSLDLEWDNYDTGVIDFYDAVLYKNKWYGKRFVSNNFN